MVEAVVVHQPVYLLMVIMVVQVTVLLEGRQFLVVVLVVMVEQVLILPQLEELQVAVVVEVPILLHIKGEMEGQVG